MADLRKVEELDGPPIVGEDYLVLSIDVWDEFCPVFGGAHIDHWIPHIEHYHLDRRFLSERIVRAWGSQTHLGEYVGISDASVPWNVKIQGTAIDAKGASAQYRRFTCLRELPQWHGKALEVMSPSDTCAKARWIGGKPHCPHQGTPLAQFWDGKAEVIRCPVHGLLVEMRHD